MKALKTFFLLTLISVSVIVQGQISQKAQKMFDTSGEVYFSFNTTDRALIDEITKMISIDNFRDGQVKAYANREEFENFLRKGIEYNLLPHPGISEEPVPMRDKIDIRSTNSWDYYPTYTAYVDMMNQFAAQYPNLCQVTEIGTTVQNRKLIVARITSNVNTVKPQFFYTSTMHGDETGGYVLLLRFIDYLLSNYGTNPRITNLVDNIEIYINPNANPDGTYYGGNNTVNGARRYNGNSVDLNRNFPDPQAGPHPDNKVWQPETISMMDFAESKNLVMSANFHGGEEVINYPWDTWSKLTADNSWWFNVSNEYADTAQANSPSGYMTSFGGTGVTNGYAWYTITGGRQDYMNYFQQVREVTVEISNTKLYPAASLPNLWNYNYRSFLNYMEECLYGIRGIVTDSLSGQPMEAMVFINGHDIDSSMVFSALPNGNYHRLINQGTYNLTFSAPGYVSKTINNVAVTNHNTTYKNVQLRPLGIFPNFSASQTAIEPNAAVNFTDLSFGNPNTWAWTFEGGSPATSTQQNPQNILYSQAGVYDVSLTASDATYSNTVMKPAYIVVGNHYPIANQTVNTCDAWFYDNGGPNHPYLNGSRRTMTFTPALPDKKIKAEFTSFNIETGTNCNKDYLKIYDGQAIGSGLVGIYCGNDSPGTIIASGSTGALTFEFFSNSADAFDGWVAHITCDSGVGTNEINAEFVRIYPNPAQNQINIQLPDGKYEFQLIDLTGNRIQNINGKGGSFQLDATALNNGLYFLRIISGNGSSLHKVIIKK
ncbi:MAG: M14 family zinc carboxypeptidase [Bacteroidales bacterium]|nr:M14 family zinc carboxypeptidase [Bacteroidales bacterium]